MCIVSGAIFLFAGLKVDEVFCPQRDGLWLQRQKTTRREDTQRGGDIICASGNSGSASSHLIPGEQTEVINGSESKALVMRMCLCWKKSRGPQPQDHSCSWLVVFSWWTILHRKTVLVQIRPSSLTSHIGPHAVGNDGTWVFCSFFTRSGSQVNPELVLWYYFTSGQL